MRLADLPLPLWLAIGAAYAHAQPQPPPPPVPVSPPPVRPSSPPPLMPAPAEAVEAFSAARQTETLVRERRFEEAIANYRAAIERPLGADAGNTWRVHSLHAAALANQLIWAGRLDDADRVMLDHLERGRAFAGRRAHEYDDELIDMRLYIAAGRGRIPDVLALIDQRAALFPETGGRRCPDSAPFPEVVAPAHHVAEVAARLRAIGCHDAILADLDRLASRTMAADRAFRLPARGRAPSAASAE